ncbi:VWA domain-containing protein [Deinococcus sp. KSM4-11]|uniref:vWA domain-containing protein n=1 Tax=Deinococcus sp. KSM4-11 TaxID=2568654 RepID=UPI0010A550D9|nr:vWA domain-containing protein [Deinococcus sp. KSM4-11]THF85824.1 VWA domain-containing protein [Deinococcus sp. KSM4-11]
MSRPAALLTALIGSTLTVAQAAPECTLPVGPLPTRTRAVFVLDTSGSMRGLGDGKANIFGRVTAAINTYVRATRPDHVELLTFDSGVRSRQDFGAPAGTARWNAALAALHADGTNTHLYRSLHAALSPLGAEGTYLTTVFVLTDGIDNDPQQAFTPEQALAAFGGRGPLDRLHYVALGTDIPPAARRALIASTYADGQTMPVNTVPDLIRIGHGGGLITVTDAAHVRVPFADTQTLSVGTDPSSRRVQLGFPAAQAGLVGLTVPGALPYGAPALLCAAPVALNGAVAPRPVRVLVRLNLPGALGLHLLNPGADRRLAAGEDVVLRYHAPGGLHLDGLKLLDLPAGLRGEIEHQPDSRDVAVKLTNTGLTAGTTARPMLLLPGGMAMTLPTVQGDAGGRVPDALPTATLHRTTAPLPSLPRWLAWLLLGVLVLAGGFAALRWRRRSASRPRAKTGVSPAPVAFADVPSVEGIEYSEDRLLALVGVNGDVTGVSTPLDGPFDVGHLARVPHLSGLRFEQHRHGLRSVQIPDDLEVSQGARLLRSGDIVRPGTLLGVAVARPARAPTVPLGSLSGLGLPLTLRAQGHTLHAAGPYGEHAVTLHPGITDLGDALEAPAVRGLRLAVTGSSVLLAELPASLGLRRPGEAESITPGTALSSLLTLDLPDVDDPGGSTPR